MKKLTLLTASIVIATNLFGQVRRDINDPFFTNADRAQLANYMMEYITSDIIEQHCNAMMVAMDMSLHIHDDVNFLPFHRAFIEGMEDFLLLKGGGTSKFVPLPSWNPEENNTLPNVFRVVNFAACSGATCTEGDGPCYTTSTVNWNPLITRPAHLKRPVVPGLNNDLCDWPEVVGNAGLSRVMEGDPNITGNTYHNSVHNNMGGVMWNFRSPSTPAFWLWHAYLDDIWKEWQCNCTNQTPSPRQIDLYIKNTPGIPHASRDLGVEPNWGTKPLWESTDIWVRNNDDGLTNDISQNPEYSASSPVYVYVKVRNRGCAPTTGTEVVKLFWSKAGTYQLYPKPWDGSVSIGGVPIGGLVQSKTIGAVIPPGGQTIVKFEWNIPNPSTFGAMDGSTAGSSTANGWHFCLLAKGENPTVDPDQGTMSNIDLGWVVADNNHVAWKNITVVDFMPGKPGFNGIDKLNGGTIAIGNLFSETRIFDFVFKAPSTYKDPKPLTDHAEVLVSLNPRAWEKWVEGGLKGYNVKIYNRELRQVVITGDSARLSNLSFDPNEIATMNVAINFLTQAVEDQLNYDYRVYQVNAVTDSVVGGESYTVIRPERDGFAANAGGDKTILEGQNATLSATSIAESAIYNWYDSNDSLIYTGKDYTVSPDVTSKYKLEVIAINDGYKDYDEVKVIVKDNYITTLAPNPASTNITVNYKLGAATTSAYLIVMQSYGASNNYILDPALNSKSIDLTSYAPGTYNVILVCNGVIVDSKSLVKY